ncbi:hypothetical protein B5M42_021680 [Paenibacillus athensensis]|uniref:Uncharacterized protein n=1 Tax=Paenibacillus athensensis TaxID=1967502 RepID=A0A4Y8Q407_9BACL|nr:hypothetical protein [Paenibacillus athensensis]MCD1261416.1 hypothetical protein [Paenibacillus athensensis]
MSEFTSGCLTPNTKKAVAYLTKQSSVIRVAPLNEDWIIFLTEDTYVDNSVSSAIQHVSSEIPVLYFYNFEDHCWGYKLLEAGRTLAEFELDYEAKHSRVIQLAQQLYPTKDIIEFLYIDIEGQAVREQLEQQVEDQYVNTVRIAYQQANIDAFRILGVSGGVLQNLGEIMSVEHFEALQSKHDLVEQFKVALGIPEMSWIRVDRLEAFDERFPSLL